VVNALKKHKAQQNQDKLDAGPLYKNNDLVVCTSAGTPMIPRNLMRTYYNLLDKCDVPRIRFHELRHTHATLLLKENVNPKIVAERLGHADVRITLDKYSHLLPDMQRDAVDQFSAAFFG
jgi:integrase